MKTKKSYKLITVFLAVMLLSSVFAGCSSEKNVSKVSPDWESEKTGFKRPVNSKDEEYKEYLIKAQDDLGKRVRPALYEASHFPVDYLLDMSSTVVRGTVIGFDYLSISPVYSDESTPFTDYYVDVLEAFRGEPETDENGLIRVRTMGGENDEMILTNDDFLFDVGKEYLFFLFKPAGGDYNTDEYGYYYPYSLSAGVYDASEETVKNERGEKVPKYFTAHTYIQYEDGEIEYLGFAEHVKEYNETHPVDVYAVVNATKENLRANLDSGFLTQEEYDRIMAEMEQYATIVD